MNGINDITIQERIILDHLLDMAIFEAEMSLENKNISPITEAALKIRVAELLTFRRKNTAAVADIIRPAPKTQKPKTAAKKPK